MNGLAILKKLLSGLLPLFAFIIADEIWGTTIGLLIAITLGIFQFLFLWFREKRADKFVLYDTLLIVLLGGVSLISDNDIFFKIKPGLIGLIFCAILAVSVFTPVNIMLNVTKRYSGGIEFNESMKKQLRVNLLTILVIFSLHTILVFYSAFYMSKEAWVFISGGLFYILFGVIMAVEIIKAIVRKMRYRNQEWLPVVDEQGNVKGKALRSVVHSDKSLIHPVVHLHVLNKSGELLLQKRSAGKDIQPGKWDTAVGGHIGINETVEKALERETFEEIGLKPSGTEFMKKYLWKSEVETELVFSFVIFSEGPFRFDKKEIEAVRFWKMNEIEQNLKKDVLTPNFVAEFTVLKEFLKRKKAGK